MGLFGSIGKLFGQKALDQGKMDAMNPLTAEQQRSLGGASAGLMQKRLSNNEYRQGRGQYMSRLQDRTNRNISDAQRRTDEMAQTGQVTGGQQAKMRRRNQRDAMDARNMAAREADIQYRDKATQFDREAIAQAMQSVMGNAEMQRGNYMNALQSRNAQSAAGLQGVTQLASAAFGI